MANNPYDAPQSDVGLGEKADDYCEVKLFSTKVRLGRLRYFNRIFAVLVGIAVVLEVWTIIVARVKKHPPDCHRLLSVNSDHVMHVMLVFFGILFLFLLSIFVFSIIQRLHDINCSGWLVLSLIIPPIYLGIALFLLLVPSRPEPNNFGAPPPKNTLFTQAVAGLFIILILLNILFT